MNKIDAHQHFWQPARGDYGWMPKDNKILNHPYLPADLAPLLKAQKIKGTVLVQAAPSIEETEYMLGLADATPYVKGVVGWIDFENKDHLSHLKRFAAHPKFKGVRPMIQDIEDVDWMLRSDIAWAYEALIDLDLTFDALGFPQHLNNFLTLLKRYPDMRTVIDHCMKPQIRDQMAGKDALTDWANGINKIADETNAYCKLSGLVVEADDGWVTQDLRAFSKHVLKAFGPERVMWGSDWPVVRLRAEYDVWHATAQTLCTHLSPKNRDMLFGGTATKFYHL